MPRNSNEQQWDNLNEIPGFTKSNHCKVCKRYVKSKRYHLPHTISFHLSEATQENIDTKYPFCCDECDYRCFQPVLMKTHIRVWHTGEKPYICPHGCGAFADHAGLSHHTDRKHGRDTPKRDVCEVEYQDDDEGDEQAPSAAQHDTVHGGPSRATRATRRFVPYAAPKKAKAAKKTRTRESLRSISPTSDAQPVQQKGVYYEAQPSPRQCHSSAATPDYPPVPPPAPTYASPAPVYNPPAPVYNPPAPSYIPPAPIYPPAAYSGDCNATYYNSYPAAAPNTTYASSSSFNQASPSSVNYASNSSDFSNLSDSFYSTTSSDSLYTSTESAVPQLSASDIKFAGFSCSSTARQTPACDATYATESPAFSNAQFDTLASAETTAFSPAQPYELPAPQVNALAPAELAADASWYYTEESSPYAASSSPYNTSSPLDNHTFDASPSENTWADYGFLASPETPVDFSFAQQSFDNLSQESWLSCSQESWLNCSQEFSLNCSQQSSFDLSQDLLLDLNPLDFADPKLGHLDRNFGDSFPVYTDAPYNAFPESDAQYNAFPGSGVQYNAFPEFGAQYDTEEIGRLLNEFVHPGAMA
ncbi:hypothetical protein EV121DRAFT_213251 [Schizophyllum commune]